MPKAAVPTSARIKAPTLFLTGVSCMRTAAWVRRTSIRPARAAAIGACILLAACGKPAKERELEALACGAYVYTLDREGNSGNASTAPLLAALQKAVVAKSPGWDKMRDFGTKMPFMLRQSDEIGAKLDFQTMSHAGAKGLEAYAQHKGDFDGPRALAYLAECLDNYEALRAR